MKKSQTNITEGLKLASNSEIASDASNNSSIENKNELINNLLVKIESLEKRYNYTVFFQVVFLFLIADAILFIYFIDGLAALSFLILQILILFILGKYLDIEDIEILANKLINFSKNMKN